MQRGELLLLPLAGQPAIQPVSWPVVSAAGSAAGRQCGGQAVRQCGSAAVRQCGSAAGRQAGRRADGRTSRQADRQAFSRQASEYSKLPIRIRHRPCKWFVRTACWCGRRIPPTKP